MTDQVSATPEITDDIDNSDLEANRNPELSELFSSINTGEAAETFGSYEQQVNSRSDEVQAALYLVRRLEQDYEFDSLLVSQLGWVDSTLADFSGRLSTGEEVDHEAIKTTLDLGAEVLNTLMSEPVFLEETNRILAEANEVISTNSFNFTEVPENFRVRAINLYEEAIDVLGELNTIQLSQNSSTGEILNAVNLFLSFTERTNNLHEIMALSSEPEELESDDNIEESSNNIEEVYLPENLIALTEADVEDAFEYLNSLDRLDPAWNENIMDFIMDAAYNHGVIPESDIAGERARTLEILDNHNAYLDYRTEDGNLYIEVVLSDGARYTNGRFIPGSPPSFGIQ